MSYSYRVIEHLYGIEHRGADLEAELDRLAGQGYRLVSSVQVASSAALIIMEREEVDPGEG